MTPVGYLVPRSADDLARMGRCFSATTFLSAGNITHTPAYGHMIALGVLHAVGQRSASAAQMQNAEAYRAKIAALAAFLRLRPGPPRSAIACGPIQANARHCRIVRETDAGLVIRGKIGMHTSPAYRRGCLHRCQQRHRLPGPSRDVRGGGECAGRNRYLPPPSAREANPFSAPLSSRFDELDGQMWLDDVLIPWEHVFLTEPSAEPVARWLFWHQLYCWLAKAEFTLGLAFACTHAMGLMSHDATIDYLIDLINDVQTVRSLPRRHRTRPGIHDEGFCAPNHAHLSAGSIAMLKARPHMGEILRALPGSSLVVAPSDHDLTDPELAAGLEESFGGGGYTALQRSALLQMAWDHVGSALDHRESVYELHANGGLGAWRNRLRRSFNRYEELANGVLQQLGLPMPQVDLTFDPRGAHGGATAGDAPPTPNKTVTGDFA